MRTISGGGGSEGSTAAELEPEIGDGDGGSEPTLAGGLVVTGDDEADARAVGLGRAVAFVSFDGPRSAYTLTPPPRRTAPTRNGHSDRFFFGVGAAGLWSGVAGAPRGSFAMAAGEAPRSSF